MSNYICNSLCTLSLGWNCAYMENIAYDIQLELDNWLENRPDFFWIDDDENIENYFDYKIHEYDITIGRSNIKELIQQFRDLHYAKYSIISLIKLIKKCIYLSDLEISCYDGIDVDKSQELIQCIHSHGLIDNLTLR
eukprot:322646_1